MTSPDMASAEVGRGEALALEIERLHRLWLRAEGDEKVGYANMLVGPLFRDIPLLIAALRAHAKATGAA